MRSLWRPLIEDARAEVNLALSVALLTNEGFNRAEIERRLAVGGASKQDVKGAWDRLERIASRIDRDSDL